MRVPFYLIEKYIDLEHSKEEFGEIMTKLDSMQDGPIKKDVNNKEYIDLEDRKNRPDLLSIIGILREYAAFIDKPLKDIPHWEDKDIPWNEPKKILNVQASDLVKRFVAVKIKNVKISKSPEWLISILESYDIPAINNIVDITNFVMLEYGMPLHAFDVKKLSKDEINSAYLVLRRSEKGEEFTTWQKTKIELDKNVLVIADSEKLVGIGGIIGGLNSGITESTKDIILESATYNHASIRKTARKYNLKTDAAALHEKILNPEMVETAIRRAIFLIQELAGGEIEIIEDYYQEKRANIIIDFNVNEIHRLSGVEFDIDEASDYLKRLGFIILDHKESLAVNTSKLLVQIPKHRTDIEREEALVGEVLRLWGYENIPLQSVNSAPPEFITPSSLILEDKLRDIFVSIGLDEQVLNPIVKYPFNDKSPDSKQVKLENSLNSEMNGLRSSLWQTFVLSIKAHKKYGLNNAAVFEIGRIYTHKKVGEYIETRVAGAYYYNHNFDLRIKPDFITVLDSLGIIEEVTTNLSADKRVLEFYYKDSLVARLYSNRYEIFTDTLCELIKVNFVPKLNIQTSYAQKIIEEVSLLTDRNINIGDLADSIKSTSKYILNVEYMNTYQGTGIASDKESILLRVIFCDSENNLKRKDIEKIKEEFLDKIKIEHGATLRK